MPFEPGALRGQLGFVPAVVSAFGFLSAYGFVLGHTSPTLVEFQSPHVVLRVFHGRGSYELGAEFEWDDGDTTSTERPFDVLEVIHSFGSPTAERPRLAATTPETVSKFVPILAQLVNDYCKPVLRNEPGVYEILLQARHLARDRFARDERIRDLRDAAEAAWRERDFGTVVGLLEQLGDALSPVEVSRLAYAKKHRGVR